MERESVSRRVKDLMSKMRSLDEDILKSTKVRWSLTRVHGWQLTSSADVVLLPTVQDNDTLHAQLLALEKERNSLTLQLSDKQKELE